MPLTLSQFTCPYREEATCKFENNPSGCKFTHPRNDRSCRSVANLLNVPFYVCIHFLNGNCRGTNQRSCSFAGKTVTGCISGLHLKLTDFVGDGNDALEKWESDNSDLLRQFYGPDIDEVCGICLEKVIGNRYARNRKFGVLQNCSHKFCAQCLIKWHTNKKFCPVCRVPSERFDVKKRISNVPIPPTVPAIPTGARVRASGDLVDAASRSMLSLSLGGSNHERTNRLTDIHDRDIRLFGQPGSSRQNGAAGRRQLNVRVERQTPPTTADALLSCQICCERVYNKSLVRRYRFAILEACDHVFCAYCVIGLRCSPFSCPVCYRKSHYFAIRESFVRQSNEKRSMFNTVHCDVGVYSFNEQDRRSLALNGLPAYLDDHYFTYIENLEFAEESFAPFEDDDDDEDDEDDYDQHRRRNNYRQRYTPGQNRRMISY